MELASLRLPVNPVISSAIAARYDTGGKYAVENSLATLVDVAFHVRVHASDDASLRISDEFDDRVPLLRLREA